MKKFFTSFAVGLPVTFLGLIIFTGSVEFAALLFVLCPVFTFGVALIVPWVVGAVTLGFIGLFVNKPNGKEEANRKRPVFSRDEVALTEYIRQAEARGMSDDKIVAHLRLNGWSEAEILKARAILADKGV